MNFKATTCLIFGLLVALPTQQTVAMQQQQPLSRQKKYALFALGTVALGCLAYLVNHAVHEYRYGTSEFVEEHNRAEVRYNAETNRYLVRYTSVIATSFRRANAHVAGASFRIAAEGQPVRVTAQDVLNDTPAVAARVNQEYEALAAAHDANPSYVEKNFPGEDVFTTWPAEDYKKCLVSLLPVSFEWRPGNEVVYELRGQELRDFLHGFASEEARLEELARRAHQQRIAAQQH